MSQIMSEHQLMCLKIREVKQPDFVLITNSEKVERAYRKMLHNHGSDFRDENEDYYSNDKPAKKIYKTAKNR